MSEQRDNQNGQSQSRGRRHEPLSIELNVVVKTGEQPEDCVTVLEDRAVPLVGSIFRYRDRITQFSLGMVWQVVAKSPAAYREVVPGLFQTLGLLRRGFKR